ncbi:MAG: 3-dehydroquinate synthase II, partial [Aquificae bacterium]|nr:3-dehydroquinate synthase II [Aquificota bacterium]
MKEFWVWVEPFDRKLVSVALEAGATAVVIPEEGRVQEVKKAGRITVISPDGDLKLGK